MITFCSRQEEVVDPSAKSSSYLTNRSNGQPYAQTAVSMDSDDGISYKGYCTLFLVLTY